MRKALFIVLLALISLSSREQNPYAQVSDTVNVAAYNPTRIQGTNYFWCLIKYPSTYFTNPTDTFPLVIFLAGAGQTGNGQAGLSVFTTSQDAYVPYEISTLKDSMDAVNLLTGATDKFIFVSIQAPTSSGWGVTAPQVDSAIGDLIHHKFAGRVQILRIYGTGLSAGGEGLYDLMAHWNGTNAAYTPAYKLASAFLQSVVLNANSPEGQIGYRFMITDSVYIQTAGDSVTDSHGITTAAIADSIHLNYITGILAAYLAATFYQYSGGHCCWLPQWLPTFTKSVTYRGVVKTGNELQLMAMHSRGILPPPGQIVIVSPGSNQSLTAGTTSTLLSGSATTNTGSITSYTWAQLTGPTVTILHPSTDTTTILGMTNGHTYTFSLTATNTGSFSGSGNVSVTVNNPVGQRIFVQYNNKWYNNDTSYLVLNPISRDSVMYKLFDEQNSVDPANNPSLIPVTFPTVAVNPQEFYPLQAVVDLGAMYQITDTYFYDMFGSDSVYFYTGSEGNWTLYYAGVTGSFNSWTHLNSSLPTTRFFRIVLKSSQTVIGEIAFYGVQQTTPLPSTPQVTHTYALPTMSSLMGVCSDGNGFIFPGLLFGLGEWVRWFQNQVWMDTNTVAHNMSSLKFNYDIFSDNTSTLNVIFPNANSSVTSYNFGLNAMMTAYTNFAAQGQNLWGTTQGFPSAMTGYNGFNGYFPIDSINHPGYRDSSVAWNYDRTGRLTYFLAGIGGNGGVSVSGQVNYPPTFNQNVLKRTEINNEIDADGVTPFWQIPAAYAMFSQYYSGAGQGAINGQGIKGADNNIEVIASGTYYLDTVWYKGIKYMYQNRTTNHLPVFDSYNLHWYYFSSPNHTNGTTSFALSPEQALVRQTLTNTVSLLHTLQPAAKIYYSEWGFDRNRNSPLHVPVISGVDSATLQAWYITRTWLAISFTGVNASTMFQFQMDPQSNPSFPHVNPYDTNAIFLFNSTGLVTFFQDPTTFTIQYVAYPAYWYMRSLNSLLSNYQADSIVSENPSSFWEYRYRNASVADSLIIAVWNPTSTNQISTNQLVSVGAPMQPVKIVQFVAGSTTGTVTNSTTDVNGFLTMTVSENPQFIMYAGPTPANNCKCIITNKQNQKLLRNQ